MRWTSEICSIEMGGLKGVSAENGWIIDNYNAQVLMYKPTCCVPKLNPKLPDFKQKNSVPPCVTPFCTTVYMCVFRSSFWNFSPSKIWPESFSPWLRFGPLGCVCMNSYAVLFPSVKISMTPRRWILMDGFGWVGFNVEVSNCQMVQNKPQLKHFKR